MDGIKKIASQVQSATKGGASAKPTSSTGAASQAAKSNASASNSATPAAVIQLNPSPQKASSGTSAVRTYEEAKGLAKSIAERINGDEHGDITPDTVKGLFLTQ